ncbi:MAG: spondin domain-containing protein [Cyanobacteria bacterium P01_G01_bin.67]
MTNNSTARFDDIDVSVEVNLAEDSATRETGFETTIEDLELVNPNDGISSDEILTEGIAGNLYYNFHTSDFNAGELRGQLEISEDLRGADGVGDVIFTSSLSGDQEVQDEPVVTDASGIATTTFTVAADGSLDYSVDVAVNGLNQGDLLPVDIGNGTLSPIHLHNAPVGENGAVVVDVFTDAGSEGIAPFTENFELTDVFDVVGSNDGDLIIGDSNPNLLQGLDGDDTIDGGGGTDILDGGEGSDTNSFATIGAPVIADLASNSASYQPNVAAGVTVFENFSNFENFEGSLQNDQLFGDGGNNVLSGNEGNDLLVGRAGDDSLKGGLGDDTLRGGGGNDATDGGEGIDTADFQDIGVGISANLNSGKAQYVVNNNLIEDQLSNIENLTGSINDDTLAGNDSNNLLAGNEGNDTLSGGAGNDIIRGDEIGSGTAIKVTVTNTQGEGGSFRTPVWFGFHDGATFDLYTEGEHASTGLERLAEDGSIEGIAAEFNAQVGENGIDGTVVGGAGVPGPIDPGESASLTLDVDPSQVGQGFFTWGTMIIPSNDAFLAVPDDALADPIFDEQGNFIGPVVIERRGSDVLDAGTEVNTEEDAAFINQTAPNTGVDENGVVTAHPGFNGSVGNPDATPVNILGGETASGAIIDPLVGDFTANDDLLLRIEIEEVSVSGGNDLLVGGAGNDTLTGGGGADIFSFSTGTGADVITDFASIDTLDLSAFNLDSHQALGAAIQDSHNTLIDLGNGDSITLENFAATDLTAENFLLA